MAYSEPLADRIRRALGPNARVTEIRMFGGLCFMVGGHMTCGVMGDEMMVRVGPRAYEAAVKRRHARPMDFVGKPMAGMVYVAAEGCATLRDVTAWVARGLAYTTTLPPRSKSKSGANRPARRGVQP